MENCAYLRKNPGYAPDVHQFSKQIKEYLFSGQLENFTSEVANILNVHLLGISTAHICSVCLLVFAPYVDLCTRLF